MKLTQKELQELYSKKQKADKSEAKINERFDYIVKTMGKILGWKINWYDYSNERGEDSPGYFDPVRYKDEIEFLGDIKRNYEYDDFEYNGAGEFFFPTRWLHEDFEDELKEKFKQFLGEIKAKEEKKDSLENEAVNKVTKVVNELKSNLSEEELLFFNVKEKFTKAEAVRLQKKMEFLKTIPKDILQKMSFETLALVEVLGEAEFKKKMSAYLGKTTKNLSKENKDKKHKELMEKLFKKDNTDTDVKVKQKKLKP